MGKIIRFPRRHGRASAVSRAARDVRSSAVTPAERARSVSISAAHHSAGMLSRCHHFDTWVGVAPGNSDARAIRSAPQSSITVLKEVKSAMPDLLGHLVLKRKVIPSLDCGHGLGHTVRMADSDTEAQFKQEFTKRVKEARIARGWKQWQAGEALGIPQDQYKQYEGRSLMPHHMIGRFCLVTRVDYEWMLTGRGKRPIKQLEVIEEPSRAEPKQKRTGGKKVA